MCQGLIHNFFSRNWEREGGKRGKKGGVCELAFMRERVTVVNLSVSHCLDLEDGIIFTFVTGT